MLPQQIAHALQARSQAEFIAGSRELARHLPAGGEPAEPILQALELIAQSGSTPPEQAQRAAIVVREVAPAVKLTAELVRQLSGLPTAVRSGVATALPPELVRNLYGQAIIARPPQAERRGRERPVCVTAQVTEPSRELERGTTVVLLSVDDNQDANARLLRVAGFGAYRVSTLETLENCLGPGDVAGFVVDSSFWRGLTAQEQEAVLVRLARYSSFACIFVDKRGFSQPDRIRSIIGGERTNDRWFHTILDESSTLSETDLQCFIASAEFLGVPEHTTFIPSSLTRSERAALVAACRAYFRDEYRVADETLDSLAFESFSTGRSSARTMVVRFNDAGTPVVVKVDARERILEEADRYDRYIRRTDAILRPCSHFHADVGVMIFGLVEDGRRAFTPAPSLDDRVHQAFRDETYSTDRGALAAACTNIEAVVARTCGKAAELNRRPYAGPHESQAYLRGSGLRQLFEHGVQWHIPELEGEGFHRCLHAAHQLTETLKQTATVHGDLHLHNVLVPHDGTPHLIDYAYSGPGHPAYDLVRLEAALLFKYLRPLGSEEEFSQLQHALSVGMLGQAELSARFPGWWSSQVNAALLAGSLQCRDHAVEVLRGYGYGREQYLACKFVVCSWSLTIPGLQVSLIRATLSAIGRELPARLGT